MNPEILTPIIGAVVVAGGWLVTHYLIRGREDRHRRLERTAEYHARQIEEFYGPLFNLVHQIFVMNHVQHEIVTARNPSGSSHLSKEQITKVRDYFQESHFAALHEQVRGILKSKLHLIHGSRMPESFYLYLRHSIQERDQRALWQREKIDTSFLHGIVWPENFYSDIKNGFEQAMDRYQAAIEGLKRT